MKPYWELDECACCGAAIGPCSNWPWHREHEDCRALREPKNITGDVDGDWLGAARKAKGE